jgi:hypothetical protein
MEAKEERWFELRQNGRLIYPSVKKKILRNSNSFSRSTEIVRDINFLKEKLNK